MDAAAKYRVWHIPQVPGKPFHVETDSLESARLIQDTLAQYDLFQFEERIKPDYSNASGVEEFLGSDGWCEVEEVDA